MFWSLIILIDNRKQAVKEDKESAPPLPQSPPEDSINKIDKISVKQGTSIHILKADEIYYLESYGDYVLIYTETEKFIKEQTMLYFENALPQQFIRIHRSYIINSDYIIRLELYGKESYNIRLKSGISLKASRSGYKLLKMRLEL
jgi:DNA-binding LytR/AlgR family response regulator